MKKMFAILLTLFSLFLIQGCSEIIGQNRKSLKLTKDVDYYKNGLAFSEKEQDQINLSVAYKNKEQYDLLEYAVFHIKIKNLSDKEILLNPEIFYYDLFPQLKIKYLSIDGGYHNGTSGESEPGTKTKKEIIIEKNNAINIKKLSDQIKKKYEKIHIKTTDDSFLDLIIDIHKTFDGKEESEEERKIKEEKKSDLILENQKKLQDISKLKDLYNKIIKEALFKTTIMPNETAKGNIYFPTSLKKDGKIIALFDFKKISLVLPLEGNQFEFEYIAE